MDTPPSKNLGFHRFINHFHRAINTRGGQDVTLLFAGEATRLLATLIEFLSKGLKLVNHKTTRTFGSKLIQNWAYTKSLASLSDKTATRMRSLSELFGEWAMLNRLWGLLDVWVMTRALYTKIASMEDRLKPANIVDNAIEVAKLFTMVSFHVCEGASVLASRAVLSLSTKTREKLTSIAIRSWAAFTFLEIGRLCIQKTRMSNQRPVELSPNWFTQWKKDFFMNLAWAPVTIHVGTPGGILPPAVIDVLGFYATGSLVRDRWIETAQHQEKPAAVKED